MATQDLTPSLSLRRPWSLAEFVAVVDETVVVCIDGGLALWNSGKLEMTHVTVARNRTGDFVDCLAAGIFNSGSLTARNSLVANRGLVECSGEIVSTGGNLTDSGGCFTEPGPGDLREGDHELNFLVTSGDRATVLLADDSVARGAATGCSEVDQRGFPRSGERCDIGAIEHGAPPGANPCTVSGLWFQPQRDGHYLQLSFVRPGEALLTWQTFDAGGENLWVYGLGRASGNVLKLSLYRNRGPALVSGSVRGAVDAVPLGTAEFRLLSCHQAAFTFAASDPLGNSTLDFSRLAATEGLFCADR